MKKLITGLALVCSTLLPINSFSQNSSEKQQNKDKGIFGISVAEFNDKTSREEVPIVPGLVFGYNREIAKDFYASLTTSLHYEAYEKNDYKVFISDLTPSLRWKPSTIFVGLGAVYRNLTSTYKETGDKTKYSGLGWTINFGIESKENSRGNSFFLESSYDQVKTDDDENMGVAKLTAGIRF